MGMDGPWVRVGIKMVLPNDFENLEWYGLGAHESYPDGKAGAKIGYYKSTVYDQYVPYIRPQEMGNKEDVRWMALTNERGSGILVVPDKTLFFQLSIIVLRI